MQVNITDFFIFKKTEACYTTETFKNCLMGVAPHGAIVCDVTCDIISYMINEGNDLLLGIIHFCLGHLSLT